MEIKKTKLPGVLKITREVFSDRRGHYIETYDKKEYTEAGIGIDFVQDDISVSKVGVLRGIHGDNETWKLISCPIGAIYLVIVNCNCDSKDFGKWESFKIADEGITQVLVPPKHGVGHLVLSPKTVFSYKQSTYYVPGKQFTYRYDDPRFNIPWPIKEPILSERDTYA